MSKNCYKLQNLSCAFENKIFDNIFKSICLKIEKLHGNLSCIIENGNIEVRDLIIMQKKKLWIQLCLPI